MFAYLTQVLGCTQLVYPPAAGTASQVGGQRIAAARNIVLSSPSDRGPVASGARYVNKLSVRPCSELPKLHKV